MLDENDVTFEYLNRTLLDHLRFLTSEFDQRINPSYPKIKREDDYDGDLKVKIKAIIGINNLHFLLYI